VDVFLSAKPLKSFRNVLISWKRSQTPKRPLLFWIYKLGSLLHLHQSARVEVAA